MLPITTEPVADLLRVTQKTCWLAVWLEKERGEPAGAWGSRPFRPKSWNWNQPAPWNNLQTPTVNHSLSQSAKQQ